MWLIELGWLVAVVLRRPVRRVARGMAGQSTVEYALVGALVVIAAAGALTILGTEVTGVFTQITNTLRGAASGH